MRPHRLLCVAAALGSSTLVVADELVDGSFEGVCPPDNCDGSLPSVAGVWVVDGHECIGESQGIVPFDGETMLRLIFTTGCAPEVSVGCETLQLLDLGDDRDLVSTGSAVFQASVWCNRIEGDDETDTAFVISVFAYAGLLSSFPSQHPGGEICSSSVSVITDGDTGTWEEVSSTFCVPSNADFLLLRCFALENVVNDLDGIEFDGHYIDAVTCSLFEGTDADANGVPDECEACAADINTDGNIDVSDLVEVILAWGPCGSPDCPCAEDTNRDGTIDVLDLLAVILDWGVCP